MAVVLAVAWLQAQGASEPGGKPQFDYSDYATVLETFVNDRGLVAYGALKKNETGLNRFLARLADLSPNRFAGWSSERRIAFLINAYNAIAIDLVVEHYPIRPNPIGFFVWPHNSIRQIPGVFDNRRYTVMGQEMTLDDIEHRRLRANYNEPRIHMALVCAAMSCPPLRQEPYTARELDAQLDGQTRRFLSEERNFRIDRERNIVYLSAIFKWFGEDFVRSYAPQSGFGEHSEVERAVLHFIAGYLGETQREYLRTGAYRVKYLDYDWSLNEQKNRG